MVNYDWIGWEQASIREKGKMKKRGKARTGAGRTLSPPQELVQSQSETRYTRDILRIATNGTI